MPARAHDGSGPSTTRVRARPGAFTLIELIVVLVGLAALAAIALPTLLDRTGDATFRQASDSLVAAIAQARLKCLGDGRARQVLARPHADRWRIVVVDWSEGESPAGPSPRPVERVVLELHEGVGFERRREEAPPSFVGPVFEEELDPPAADAAHEAPPAEGWPIAVFASDGEAFPGEALVLVDRSGRRARLTIDAGARRVLLEPVVDPPAPAAEGPAAPDGGDAP
ncbi:MAG: hypothetical protein FJ255_07345 [Phycisphaerae bacterium]|nr:hypothetical protein [Phycisphaerae bacterium]